MNILCVFGQHNYGNPHRGISYEYANFIPAFRRLGNHVVHFESWNKSRYKNFAELNRQLLVTVESTKPDLVFFALMGYEVWTESIALIKSISNAVIVNWATDDSWKYDQHSRFIIPSFDLYATTYREAKIKAVEAGYRNIILTQWGANAETLQEPIPASQCRWDVSFIGTAYGNRTRWISSLKDRGIQVQCFGHGWQRGTIPVEAISDIIRHSRITLNFGDSNWILRGIVPSHSRQVKARVFEVPGCGGFLLTEDAPMLDNFYRPQKEIVVFRGIDDLTKKIRYFLSHPEERDIIACSGYRRTRDEHTYDLRFAQLLKDVEAIKMRCLNGIKQFKNTQNIDRFFKNLERQHQADPFLNFVKMALVVPCKLICGPVRGPRAARRILFEISWRFFGEKTYTASGWPGRLFYHES